MRQDDIDAVVLSMHMLRRDLKISEVVQGENCTKHLEVFVGTGNSNKCDQIGKNDKLTESTK